MEFSRTTRQTKLLTIVLAAIIALCAATLVGCHKQAATTEKTAMYYLYDENEGTFDDKEAIKIDGEKCTVHVEGGDRLKDLVIDGKATYDGNKVHGNCGMIVTKLSDFMSRKGLEDLYEDLGVTKLDISFTANIKCEFDGIKYANAIVVTKQTMTIKGFTGLLSMLNSSDTSTEREVYCKKGQTPDYSVNVTIDCNGGTLDGKSSVVKRTDKTGKLDLSDIEPTRSGYVFSGFSNAADNDSYTYRDQITRNEDVTIYAQWRQLISVTFDINSSEYKVDGETAVQVGKGISINRPKIVPIVDNPTTRFKGWYDGTSICFGTFGTYFYTDTVVKAQWYTASEVAEYNSTSQTFHYNRQFIVHFTPNDYTPSSHGLHGGCFYSFIAYGMKNGQKDKLLCRNNGSFEHSDEAGCVFFLDRDVDYDNIYATDVYLEIWYDDKVLGSVLIKKSDLGLVHFNESYNTTHIFLNENDLSKYSTKW